MLDHILTAARTNNHTRLRHYREMYARQVPMASSSDILIEKSPQYAGGSGTGAHLYLLLTRPNFRIIEPWERFTPT